MRLLIIASENSSCSDCHHGWINLEFIDNVCLRRYVCHEHINLIKIIVMNPMLGTKIKFVWWVDEFKDLIFNVEEVVDVVEVNEIRNLIIIEI